MCVYPDDAGIRIFAVQLVKGRKGNQAGAAQRNDAFRLLFGNDLLRLSEPLQNLRFAIHAMDGLGMLQTRSRQIDFELGLLRIGRHDQTEPLRAQITGIESPADLIGIQQTNGFHDYSFRRRAPAGPDQ